MCGIVGIYLKNKKYNSQLGKFLTGMMNSMATRGPDSAGFAIYSSEKKKKYKYSVCSNTDQVKEISKKLSKHVKDIKVKSISDHLIIETVMKPKKFIEILKNHEELSLVGYGSCIEIFKQVGNPKDVVKNFSLEKFLAHMLLGIQGWQQKVQSRQMALIHIPQVRMNVLYITDPCQIITI